MFDFLDYSKTSALSIKYDNTKYNCAYVKIAAPKNLDPTTGRVSSYDWDKAPNYTLDTKELVAFAKEIRQVLKGTIPNTPIHQYTNQSRQIVAARTQEGLFVIAMQADGVKHQHILSADKLLEFDDMMTFIVGDPEETVKMSHLKFFYNIVCAHITYAVAVAGGAAKGNKGNTNQKSNAGNVLDALGATKPNQVSSLAQDISGSLGQQTKENPAAGLL